MDVVSALKKPEAYSHKADDISHISTAISDVFLTGEYAYKICKPVNLGFLNFTTLKKRKKEIEDGYTHNSLISPKLYLGVSKVTSDKGKISIDGKGRVVEYALKMKQMNPDSLASNIIKERDLINDEIKGIARIIADFHSKAPCDKKISKYGSLKTIKLNWKENFSQVRECLGKYLSREDYDFIKEKIIGFIEKNQALFNKRIADNRIKHCHGDFHTGNVFLDKNKIYVFDSIVFNKRFPCSDIAAEIAFMLMDLEYHGKEKSAEVFLQEYLRLTKDTEMLKLLDFYKCYRAYIRAKVAIFTLQTKESVEEEEKAKKYFALSKKYAEKL